MDAARVGYPLVLKAVSAQLPHKTEAGAVALNLRDAAALEAALVQMRQRIAAYAPQVAFDQILLEPMAAPPLAELIVGIKREHDFALALVIGAGGVLVELLKDSVSLLLPTTDSAIRAALLSLRSASLLQGFRGRPRRPGRLGRSHPRGSRLCLRKRGATAGTGCEPTDGRCPRHPRGRRADPPRPGARRTT